MKYESYLVNSLDTVFYDGELYSDSIQSARIFKNEAFSFQTAFRAVFEDGEGNGWNDTSEFKVEVMSEINNSIDIYFVENVPAFRVGYSTADDWFLRKNPGLYPDCLCRKNGNCFSVTAGYWKSIWININENTDIKPGEYQIGIKIINTENNLTAAEKSIKIQVCDISLPKQNTVLTNWVHYDCISYFSRTKPFSDSFFSCLKKYIRMAAKNGQNMILTPAFTPPLDTPVGEERKTVQLVSVRKENGKYSFDFSLMKKFIDTALSCGTEYFEHSHFYTQWGAKCAPKIIVTENGKEKKMFGWHTDAQSDEYRYFLHSYITELKKFMKTNGYEKRFFFHISDEPEEKNLKSYEFASKFLRNELKGYLTGDALSNYAFFENGLTDNPIVNTRSIKDFLGKTERLWLYYTGYECNEYMSNRLIGMPQERGRILGFQLYYFGIKGFLNWGFNAHHNCLARSMVNPKISSDMNGDFVSGTSYLVYPDGKNVEPSVRLMTIRDEMQDIRACELLESLYGRDFVLSVISKHIPDISFNCKIHADQILSLRSEINSKIQTAYDNI